MDSDVMVTIGIPVYNAGKYLKNAIDSVLSQTYPHIEVLIIIDGATDDSIDIVKRYNDPRIRLIADAENRGIACRLNQQMNLAKGDYFARMDADDIMFPDRIEKQVEFMLENPDIDAIGSQAVVIDDNNNIIGYRESDTVFSVSSIQNRILFIHPTVFGKRAWFLKNPYSEDLDGVEDYFLWNTAFRGSKFCVLNIPLVFYRDPPVSSISTYLKRQKQLRRALVRLSHVPVMSNFRFCKLSVKSMLKSVIYSVLGKINFSKYLMARRNIPVPSDDLYLYSGMLEKIIKSDNT
jgi:glycosyltransferase involved in cell wall biosynthesis